MDANLHPSSPCSLRCVRCTDKVLWAVFGVINKCCVKGCFDVVVASGRSVTTTSLDVGEADLSVSEAINFR